MKYPLLGLVDDDNMIYIFENDEQFKSTSIEIFNQKNLLGVTYVDSVGDVYKVKNITNRV